MLCLPTNTIIVRVYHIIIHQQHVCTLMKFIICIKKVLLFYTWQVKCNGLYVCMYMYVCLYTHVHMCGSIHVCICMYVFVCVSTRIHSHPSISMRDFLWESLETLESAHDQASPLCKRVWYFHITHSNLLCTWIISRLMWISNTM